MQKSLLQSSKGMSRLSPRSVLLPAAEVSTGHPRHCVDVRQLSLFKNKSIFAVEQIVIRLSALFIYPQSRKEPLKMPNPHFNVSITQRSRGQSAVAGAAYQSGDRLLSEYDQKYNDYSRKQGIVYTEIMLPSNAPPEFADRETLWNAAEEIEKTVELATFPAICSHTSEGSPCYAISADGQGLLHRVFCFKRNVLRLCYSRPRPTGA